MRLRGLEACVPSQALHQEWPGEEQLSVISYCSSRGSTILNRFAPCIYYYYRLIADSSESPNLLQFPGESTASMLLRTEGGREKEEAAPGVARRGWNSPRCASSKLLWSLKQDEGSTWRGTGQGGGWGTLWGAQCSQGRNHLSCMQAIL